MQPPTPRLTLTRNDGSDPFHRQDFIDNWNKLDAAPGVHVCTSTSPPNWTAAQAGRIILETDTRTQKVWTGTAFLPLLTATSGWVLGSSPNQGLSKGVSGTYSLGSITTSRPGLFLLSLHGVVASSDDAPQKVDMVPWVNNAAVHVGMTGMKQWNGAGAGTSFADYTAIAAIGWQPVVPGTTYTIQARFTVGTYSTQVVNVYRLGCSITLINDVSR